MRRKVIKQGHNTLTITLPNSWVKRFNLKAGDDIQVLEQEHGLVISTERKDDHRKTTIDITGLDIPTIWKYFMAVYREGYDEVKVVFRPQDRYEHPYKFFTSHAVDSHYEKKKQSCLPFELVQQITHRFIGFEVIEHHPNYCIIRDMADLSPKEFDSSLRRVFLLVQQMGEEIISSIQKDTPTSLLHLHDIDIQVDKFHDYCIRVLHKTGFKGIKKSNIIFSILYLLELVGDEFKNIARHLLEDLNGKSLKNLLQLAELTQDHFNQFYNLFYQFDQNKALAMSKRDMDIYFYLPELHKKKSGKISGLSYEELEVYSHFRRISRYLNALVELRIEMEF